MANSCRLSPNRSVPFKSRSSACFPYPPRSMRKSEKARETGPRKLRNVRCSSPEKPFHTTQIWLRVAKPEQTMHDPKAWPRNGQPLFLACPVCKRVSKHSEGVQAYPPEELHNSLQSGKVWLRISFLCGTGDCKTPAEFHVQMER